MLTDVLEEGAEAIVPSHDDVLEVLRGDADSTPDLSKAGSEGFLKRFLAGVRGFVGLAAKVFEPDFGACIP